jgi:integral membrane protein (TIGR01906 family)
VRGFFYRTGAIIAGLLVILLSLAIVVYSVGTDRQVYYAENEKLYTAERTGMSEKDLARVTDSIVDYLLGAENLNVTVEIHGVSREVFNERELTHMVDVRALFAALRTGIWVGALCLLLLLLSYIAVFKKKAGAVLCGGFLGVVVFFVAFCGAVAIWAAIDFSSFWNTFHTVFFQNDLWQLDYRTDVLIQIMPEQFFVDFVVRIALWFAGVLAVLTAAAAVCRRRLFSRRLPGGGGE